MFTVCLQSDMKHIVTYLNSKDCLSCGITFLSPPFYYTYDFHISYLQFNTKSLHFKEAGVRNMKLKTSFKTGLQKKSSIS